MQRFHDEMEDEEAATGRGWLNGILLGAILWLVIIMIVNWII
ncbi:hypothetical protein [Paenibacillus sp. 1001270B_150601_E10]|nr:hypothetical protein [Paenibacillus sp. 1001270B_150601_E10]